MKPSVANKSIPFDDGMKENSTVPPGVGTAMGAKTLKQNAKILCILAAEDISNIR